jgi:hypothetical protein
MPNPASVAVLPVTGAHFLSESKLRAPQPLHERLPSPTGFDNQESAITLQSVKLELVRSLVYFYCRPCSVSPCVWVYRRIRIPFNGELRLASPSHRLP